VSIFRDDSPLYNVVEACNPRNSPSTDTDFLLRWSFVTRLIDSLPQRV